MIRRITTKTTNQGRSGVSNKLTRPLPARLSSGMLRGLSIGIILASGAGRPLWLCLIYGEILHLGTRPGTYRFSDKPGVSLHSYSGDVDPPCFWGEQSCSPRRLFNHVNHLSRRTRFPNYTSNWFGTTSTVLPNCSCLTRFQVLQKLRLGEPHWIVYIPNGKNECGTLD